MKNIFDEEITMCQKLYKSKKCHWGKCKDCGVIFLLYKLYKEKLIDDKKEIKELREKLFVN
jgi:hypothetical protein